jgi:hypothetical protein
VEALCHQEGAGFYSAFDAIAQAFRAGQPVYLEGDMHFSPHGQAVWSADLAEHVGPAILERSQAFPLSFR